MGASLTDLRGIPKFPVVSSGVFDGKEGRGRNEEVAGNWEG